MKMTRILASVLAVLMLCSTAFAGGTSDKATDDPLAGYPSKTIEMIVPAAAGAALDLYTRALNDNLDLGGTMIITNMPGGSQTIGMMELANRKSDGYSLGIVACAGGIIQPQLIPLTYDIDSFRPVAVTSGPNAYSICVGIDSPIEDYDDFVEYISSGETIYWTAPNSGAPAHLAGLYFLSELGIDNCEFVPYNGSAEAFAALLSGDVTFFINDDNAVAVRMAESQAKGIITLSDDRSPCLPNTICAGEIGIDGMGAFEGYSWIVVPADMPDALYGYIKERIDAAVTSEGYTQFLINSDFEPVKAYTEEELDTMIRASYDAVAEVLSTMQQ